MMYILLYIFYYIFYFFIIIIWVCVVCCCRLLLFVASFIQTLIAHLWLVKTLQSRFTYDRKRTTWTFIANKKKMSSSGSSRPLKMAKLNCVSKQDAMRVLELEKISSMILLTSLDKHGYCDCKEICVRFGMRRNEK